MTKVAGKNAADLTPQRLEVIPFTDRDGEKFNIFCAVGFNPSVVLATCEHREYAEFIINVCGSHQEMIDVMRSLISELATTRALAKEKGVHFSNERTNMASAYIRWANKVIDKATGAA